MLEQGCDNDIIIKENYQPLTITNYVNLVPYEKNVKFTSLFEPATRVNSKLSYHPNNPNHYPKADIYTYDKQT